jgi:integrase
MKLQSTKTSNLFFKLNQQTNEKTYYARFRKDKKEFRRKLTTNLKESKILLKELLNSNTIEPILRDKNSIDNIKDKNNGNTKYSLNSVFKEYMQITATNQSNQEVRTKLSRYKLHIEPILGHKSIKFLKYKDCQKVINHALEVKELTPKTAKNIKALLQAVLNFAVKNEYIDKNVANFVEIPSFDNKVSMLLELHEIRTLIDTILNIDNPIYKLIFLFALHGRRKSEILNMQWYQIDFLNQEYKIPAQKNKSKKSDVHKMTGLLYTHLKEFYNSSFTHEIDLNQYLFLNPQTQKPYTDIRRYFLSLKENCGILKPFRFHDFRHLLATVLINQCKLPIETVSYALGHSSIEVTQRYITKNSNLSKESVNDFLSFIGVQNFSV